MSTLKISLDELKAAIGEIEGRSQDLHITMNITDRQLKLSATDRSDNVIEVILYDGCNLGAQFRCTERLMFMKEKKRI